MGMTIAHKIIASHLVGGEMTPGSEIALKIDQTLTQDATGTMAYLQFEAMGIDRVKTELSVAYIDHNTLQNGFENADDHRYIQTVAKKHGLRFSRPGNGICHQVHLERFGIPGKTLIGSDSHTPTGGGIGMLAFGAGGLDVAVAMGGGAYCIEMPRILRVNLTGSLSPWVSAKDVILELLRRLSVKGGVGKIIEYGGEGVATLSVPERATITNMGAELGATTSVFPADEVTRAFMKAQGREADFVPVAADADAVYDEVVELDLSALRPLAACPHSPDNVKPVSELGEIKIDQVCIGSCTNSSYVDMMKVAAILKGKTVAPNVSLAVAPGSKQVFQMLAANGALADIIAAGARVLECACGPCIGMGQSPNSAGVSLRTFNRNFTGRSGTKDAGVYLVSPEVAAVSAVRGVLTDPTTCGACPRVAMPEAFLVNDNMIELPGGGGVAHRRARAEHQALSAVGKAARCDRKDLHPQGGRQHHHRPYHAGRQQDSALPLEHSVFVQILLRGLRRELPRTREGGRRRHRGRRLELRAGLLARACGARAAVSGREGRRRQELCANPSGEPHQLRHPSARVCRPDRL